MESHKTMGWDGHPNVNVPFTVPKGNLEAPSQATGFKDKDVLFGNIIMSPDINKHFLTSKHFNSHYLIKSHNLPEKSRLHHFYFQMDKLRQSLMEYETLIVEPLDI